MKRANTNKNRKPSLHTVEKKTATSAVIYCRVSTREQGDSGLGLEAQENFCRNVCAQMGLQVLAVFTEVSSGAKNPLKRPEIMQAITVANNNDALLVSAKLDRLSRDYITAAQLLEGQLLPATPTVLIAESPNAAMLELRLRAIIAAEERELISKRTKSALDAKRQRQPEFVNGRTGKEQYLESVDSNTEAVMKKAAYYRRSGLSWSKVADRINDLGYRTSRGTLWTANYLTKQFMANPDSKCLTRSRGKTNSISC